MQKPPFIFYLISCLFFYLRKFFSDWYLEGFYFFWQLWFKTLRFLERRFAVVASVYYWGVPLWQEYSFGGYFLSIPIRTLKIIFGGLFYLLVTVIFILLYFFWILIPLYLLSGIFK